MSRSCSYRPGPMIALAARIAMSASPSIQPGIFASDQGHVLRIVGSIHSDVSTVKGEKGEGSALDGGPRHDTFHVTGTGNTINDIAASDSLHGTLATNNTLQSDAGVVTKPITAAGKALQGHLDGLDVEQNWLIGDTIDWQTGRHEKTNYTVPATDTHCSAYASAVAQGLGIDLLIPDQHQGIYGGQGFLADAQNYWLYHSTDPVNSLLAATDDIKPGTPTAESKGWANVATSLPKNTTPAEVALALVTEAQNLANQGYLVVTSYNNFATKTASNGKGQIQEPGHIAVIYPADLTASELAAPGPKETQAGKLNLLNRSFSLGFAAHIKGYHGKLHGWMKAIAWQIGQFLLSYSNPYIKTAVVPL